MSRPLVSQQQFSSMQTRQTDFKNLKYYYTKYKKEHREEHPRAFWKEHEKEPWFMEKYNPMTIYQFKQECMELCRQKASNFISALPLPGLNLVKQENQDEEQM